MSMSRAARARQVVASKMIRCETIARGTARHVLAVKRSSGECVAWVETRNFRALARYTGKTLREVTAKAIEGSKLRVVRGTKPQRVC